MFEPPQFLMYSAKQYCPAILQSHTLNRQQIYDVPSEHLSVPIRNARRAEKISQFHTNFSNELVLLLDLWIIIAQKYPETYKFMTAYSISSY